MQNIQMVDLKGQYKKIKKEVDEAVIACMEDSAFINGEAVKIFEKNLSTYQNIKHVISCANGTDALQIALMALGLKRGDEVICPAFTYVATAEVVGLLGLKPIMADVDENTFTINVNNLDEVVTSNTKAIIPVHLYGQTCNMEAILHFAKQHNLYVIEDNAQALGASYTFSDGTVNKSGTMGDIACTSFFPSKNLGCFGDGGAMMTDNDDLAVKLRMIANHGQKKKYYHEVLGCNSRLDTIQAAILNIKLRYLDEYSARRNDMANEYYTKLSNIQELQLPSKQENSTHVFHQYTIRVLNGKRNQLQEFLQSKGIPSIIYYPLPLYKQNAFKQYVSEDFNLPVTEQLCSEVLSLPIHTEKNDEHVQIICNAISKFFNAQYFAHETAVIDKDCKIGKGTKIWHFSHIMSHCKIGNNCNIGQNVVIAPDVVVGDNCKIQNNVSVYTGVICEDDVFMGPSMVFTNVINPRSAVNRKSEYMQTYVKKGATFGANCTVICGVTIGKFAFIGAGAVVTKDVKDYALVVGNPGKQIGWISEYGQRLHFNENNIAVCKTSKAEYKLENDKIIKIKN